MPTEKEVLRYKDQWIKALTETIAKYQYCIDNDEMYDIDSDKCPLCLVDEHIAIEKDDFPLCDNCIHLSPFSKEIACFDQLSFMRIQDPVEDISILEILTTRMKYLQSILDKLNKAH